MPDFLSMLGAMNGANSGFLGITPDQQKQFDAL